MRSEGVRSDNQVFNVVGVELEQQIFEVGVHLAPVSSRGGTAW
jgi:hypothetical protein